MAEYFPIDVNGTGNYYGNFYGALYGTASYAISAAYAPGGGTPGGSNTNIQFNQLGSFGGDSNFKYTSASALVTINGDLSVTNKIDTVNRYLYDSTPIPSIDWENRTLYDTTSNMSIDWKSRILYSLNSYNAFTFDNEIYTYSNFYHASIKAQDIAQQSFSLDSSSFAGDIIYGDIHSSVTASNLVYLESGDGKWYPVNQTTTSSTKMLGICLETDGKEAIILLEGHVTVNGNNSGVGPYVPDVDHGLPIYMKSGSLASMSTIAPTSNYIRLLGHAYYNNTISSSQWIMKFKPDNTWTKI